MKFYIDPAELFQSSLNKPLTFFLKCKSLSPVILSIFWNRKVKNVHEQHCRDVNNYPQVNLRFRLLLNYFPKTSSVCTHLASKSWIAKWQNIHEPFVKCICYPILLREELVLRRNNSLYQY